MEQLTWNYCREKIDTWSKEAETNLNITVKYIQMYRDNLDSGETLARVLSELNYRVLRLGDLQAKYKRLELWADKRYELEKGLAAVELIRNGKSAAYAKEAKYENLHEYLDIVVDASAMHMRLQNGRSSARDTTDAIRSRLSQIKQG